MIRYRIGAGIACWLILTTCCLSQSQRLFVSADGRAPADFFMDLSLQTGLNIIYADHVIDKLPDITLVMKGVSVDEVLTSALQGTGIKFSISGDQIVLFSPALTANRFTISGVVTDSISGEPLISAYIYDPVTGKSTVTNNYGYYSITLPKGQVALTVGYLNYEPKSIRMEVLSNQILPLQLHPGGILKEIIVNANLHGDREGTQVPPAERITLEQLQSRIHLGGSSDLYRAAEFIPGVHTGTDGVGGIHIRGGANDQNLILMDGVPIYHPNHLFGIVSVFNHQVLQQASIYKANFPSRFSGRLSSVMDVRTREGNLDHAAFAGHIGVSEIGMMAEGPLVKNKVSVLVSSRFFLPGLIMPDITRRYKQRNDVGGMADLDYFDFNGKINWKMGHKDRLYFSVYHGKDKFADLTQTSRDEIDRDAGIRIVTQEDYDKRFNWRNQTAVLRWNHILSDKIFANVILSTSEFVLQSLDKSNLEYTFPETSLEDVSFFDTKEFKSGIKDVTGRVELDIRPSAEHTLTSGLYGIAYRFQPKSITINEESKVGEFFLNEGLLDDTYFDQFSVKAFESGVYFEDKWSINDQLRLTSGLHISGFFVQGVYYLDPQLRVSFDYMPHEKLAFNIGYSRMAQYLHNLTSSSIGLPTDLWVPTTAKAAPALSDQYAISGYWRPHPGLILDVSAYIKDMRSLISYQEGASFLLKEGLLPASIVDAANWESKITEGIGEASGIELRGRFESKLTSLEANVTYSRSYRTFEDINSGKPFPDRYDRRWSFSAIGQVKLGTRWTCSANWIFGTGIAITLAESKFFNPGALFPVIGISYPERNGHRLPPYHRLDLNLEYELGQQSKFSHSLILNLYNVYNRLNPFYITLVQDPINLDFEFRQFSLFRFLPSVSYRFAFK